MDFKCPICEQKVNSISRISRSSNLIELGNCSNCDFIFSNKDKSDSLKNNQLDVTRLENAGMEVPSIKEDFKNGSIQSSDYYEEYIDKNERNLDILEIGSSWGYFLNICKSKGHNPIGIEINNLRKEFIKNELKIKCFSSINDLNHNVKFDKIFLFYVIEYINDPTKYFKKLISLIKNNGEIIIITPNKNDVISNIWELQSYMKFIIDEHVVNYFSVKSFDYFISIFQEQDFEIKTKQGYSFFNHLKWYFTNKPSTTGIVGGDNFTEDIIKQIINKKYNSKENISISKEIKNLIINTEKDYKQIIERNNLGNQIIIKIKNKK